MEDIEIISNPEGLPVSIIVSVKPNREWFFIKYALPTLIFNNAKEIIINRSNAGAAEKWNQSYRLTTQPYVFLSSDDFILPPNHILSFYNCLKNTSQNIGYAYTESYYMFPLERAFNTFGGNFKLIFPDFDIEILKKGNFVDGSCLWKRENWVDYDPKLKRLLDWDIALNNYINNGISGVKVPDSQFLAFNLDNGISALENNLEDAITVIKNKYNL